MGLPSYGAQLKIKPSPNYLLKTHFLGKKRAKYEKIRKSYALPLGDLRHLGYKDSTFE